MKKTILLLGAGILLGGMGPVFSQTVSSSPTAVTAAPTGTVTPSATPAHRKKRKKAAATVRPSQTTTPSITTTPSVKAVHKKSKKKAGAAATAQSTQTTMPSLAATSTATPKATNTASPNPTSTPTDTTTPYPSVKATATAKPALAVTPLVTPKPAAKAETLPASGTSPDTSLADGDNAYAKKDFATAMSNYGDYIKAHGKTPAVEKKLLLSKFYAGEALENDARAGIKEESSFIESDRETHNIDVYGKRQPTREDHLVTLSLAILTPQLAGGDIGLNLLAHWNVGVGISPLGLDPRIKYYFNGDNASFFLGVGYASYNLDLSKWGVSGDASSISFSGNFLHFTFGPSFQDKNGFFMEIPFDLGLANINYVIPDGNGGSPKPGSYNGPMGTIGFRFGFSI